MAQAFFGGVHPHDMKAATNEKAIEQLAPPATVVIPMSMHFGAPCTPIVKVGDQVKVGQKIGEFKGLGAPIHASVSGTVKAIEPRPFSMGGDMVSVVIENDFQNTVSEEVKAPADPDALTVEEMVEIVKNAGIVGMGGATFPTHVKISGGIGKVKDRASSTALSASLTSPATIGPCWSVPRRSSAALPIWPRCSAWTRSSSALRTTSRTASTP
ncbi:MAG: hypothetical protein ACLSHO_00365 [Dysosmobacter sp.]